QVRVGPLGRQQHPKNFVGMVAVAQARPKVYAPADTPAGGVVAADLQRTPSGRGKLRRPVHVDLPAWVEPVEMRDVTMVDLRRLHVPILEPLLKLPGLADAARRQPGARVTHRRSKLVLDAELGGGREQRFEQVAD